MKNPGCLLETETEIFLKFGPLDYKTSITGLCTLGISYYYYYYYYFIYFTRVFPTDLWSSYGSP